ncbi:MAG: IclR family transcriptional regulator [Clostridium sp.]|nr:IclR family transcriptional regulator [Clostridium sp.]
MIQSLLRSMEILEILKENSHKYSIAELADRTSLPPSTIHRILQTFCDMNYVLRDDSAHTYELGPALIPLGRAAASNFRIQNAAAPILRQLSASSREDSFLVIQSSDKGLVLVKQDGPNHLKVVEEFGYEMDLHCGAIRKVLLAYQSEAYIDYYLNTRLDRPEAFPQISRRALEQELAQIRSDGIAVTHGEYVHDAVGIGAPIFGPDNKVIASIGLIAPYSRITDDDHLHRLMGEVKAAAHDLSVMSGSSVI